MAICPRLGAIESLEVRVMMAADPWTTYQSALATNMGTFTSQAQAEQASFNQTDTADVNALTADEQTVNAGLASNAATQFQTLSSTANTATATEHSSDAAADQQATTLNQAADTLLTQQVNTDEQNLTSQNAGPQAQLATTEQNADATFASTQTADQNQYNTTAASDQATHDGNVANIQAGYNATLNAEQNQDNQNQANINANLQSEIAAAAATRDATIGSAVPTVPNDAGTHSAAYQAIEQAANTTYTNAIQHANNDLASGYATADGNMNTKLNVAMSAWNTAQTNAQNTANGKFQTAQTNYATAIAPLQTTLTNTLAGDQATYNSSMQTALNTYNSDMATANANHTSSYTTAQNNYNSSAQPVINGYNSFVTTRTNQFNSDIANRDATCKTALTGEQTTFNNKVAGYASQEQSDLQAALTAYTNSIATCLATKSSSDQGAQNTFNQAVQGADQILNTAQNTYNNTVNQIYMQAMMNHTSPDQGQLQAAMNTLLTAKHTHANSVASAGATLAQSLGADWITYETQEGPIFVTYADAVATAIGSYTTKTATALHTMLDNMSDDYASDDQDDANITATFNSDLATHEEAEQVQLAGFTKTQLDADDDADAALANATIAAQAKYDNAEYDAELVQGEADLAANIAYDTNTEGPFQTEQNAEAQANKDEEHDLSIAIQAYVNASAAAYDQDVLDRQNVYQGVVTEVGNAVTGLIDQLAPAWAATVIAASGNDPGTTTWANAWANYWKTAAGDDVSATEQIVAEQTGIVAQGITAHEGMVSQVATQDQTLADELGTAGLTQDKNDIAAEIADESTILPVANSTDDQIMSNIRATVGIEIAQTATDENSHVTNDTTDQKEYNTSWLTWVNTVMPVALSVGTAINGLWASAVGTIASDEAALAKNVDSKKESMTDNITTDWKSMIHNDALATKTYALAADNNVAATENTNQTNYVNTLAGLPDSQFASESNGGMSARPAQLGGMTTSKQVGDQNVPYTVQQVPYTFNSASQGSMFWQTYKKYSINVWTGASTGLVSGAATGGLTGAAVGGVATGGPGALPGAGVGAGLGGAAGFINGIFQGAMANNPQQAARRSVEGGIMAGSLLGGVGMPGLPASGGVTGGRVLTAAQREINATAAYIAAKRANIAKLYQDRQTLLQNQNIDTVLANPDVYRGLAARLKSIDEAIATCNLDIQEAKATIDLLLPGN